MADQEIVLGDSRPYTVALKINGNPFAINPSSDVVKAAIISADKKKLLAGPITLLSTTPGGDWANSTLIVKFPRALTADVAIIGKALLEVQVTFDNADASVDDDDWTWFLPVTLSRGQL